MPNNGDWTLRTYLQDARNSGRARRTQLAQTTPTKFGVIIKLLQVKITIIHSTKIVKLYMYNRMELVGGITCFYST